MIEHEVKFQGRGLQYVFEEIAGSSDIYYSNFDTDYFDKNDALYRAGYSLRSRKGSVELKQTKGLSRVELRADVDDVSEGLEELKGHELFPSGLKHIKAKDLSHVFTIASERLTAHKYIHLPRGIADVEIALDKTDYYKVKTPSFEKISSDTELELEFIKMTNTDGTLHDITEGDLAHLQNWAMVGNGIRPQPMSKIERAHLYDEVCLRVG